MIRYPSQIFQSLYSFFSPRSSSSGVKEEPSALPFKKEERKNLPLAKEEPALTFKREESRKELLSERRVSPVRIVTISILKSGRKFPLMLKMECVGVPFEVVLSTGSDGSVLSSKVYDRIVRKTKDPGYQLQEAHNIEVRDIAGKPMKLRGILQAPCKFICAHYGEENSVTEIVTFLVVENLIADGVFGSPEIDYHNLCLMFERARNSVAWFFNQNPPVGIGILES